MPPAHGRSSASTAAPVLGSRYRSTPWNATTFAERNGERLTQPCETVALFAGEPSLTRKKKKKKKKNKTGLSRPLSGYNIQEGSTQESENPW